jgi:hypothetical protein
LNDATDASMTIGSIELLSSVLRRAKDFKNLDAAVAILL